MARGAKWGDYSREAINRGTAIIQGNTVSYSNVNNSFGTPLYIRDCVCLMLLIDLAISQISLH